MAEIFENSVKVKQITTIILVGLLMISITKKSTAQDLLYSQFYRNPIYLNPSLTALQKCGRAYLHHRNSAWGAQDIAAYSLAFDIPFIKTKSGFGGIFQHQEEGIMRTTTFNLQFSRKVNLTQELFITMGIEAGGIFRYYNASEMQLPSQVLLSASVYEGNPLPSTFIYDISAGIGLNYKNIHHLGFASHHLTEPQIDDLRTNSFLYRKYTLHYAARLPYRLQGAKEGYIAPQFIFENQKENNHLTSGVYGFYNNIGVGLWIRNHFPFQSSILVLMGTIKTLNFEFSYSYDIPINGSGVFSGAHEIALTYYLTSFKKKYRKLKNKNCLSF